ncbi:MAG: sigma 54-interacting transcriptional regulator [Planctomycetes bacterium]|nr:sigma 54-interacting transcriptional regulator [Planctomycetota bacterium]
MREAANKTVQQLELAGKLADEICRGVPFDEIFNGLYAKLFALIPCQRIAIGFLHADGETIVFGPVRSGGTVLLATGFKEQLGALALRDVLERSRTKNIQDLKAAASRKPFSKAYALLVEEGMRSCLAVPLVAADRPFGTLLFSSRQKEAFAREHEPFARLIAGQLALVLEKGRLVGRLQAGGIKLAESSKVKERLQDENRRLRDALARPPDLDELVGGSPVWHKTLRQIELVAKADATVLIRGETGTGKELVARAVHRLSARAAKPFVAVNCAALSAELIASELFGHEKGAFTGAVERKIGRIELAEGGTLFLDEIGDLSGDLQVKLLRVLQEREFERVGSGLTLRADVRIVAATNRNLEQARADGRFRDDLFFRLNVFPLRVPPLRERKEDIEPLLRHVLKQFEHRLNKRFDSVDPQTLERCIDYHWPGNVRELRNLAERAAILCPGPVLSLDPMADFEAQEGDRVPESGKLHDVIRAHLIRVLKRTHGKIYGGDGSARALGMKPTTLQAKLKRFGIDRRQVLDL